MMVRAGTSYTETPRDIWASRRSPCTHRARSSRARSRSCPPRPASPVGTQKTCGVGKATEAELHEHNHRVVLSPMSNTQDHACASWSLMVVSDRGKANMELVGTVVCANAPTRRRRVVTPPRSLTSLAPSISRQSTKTRSLSCSHKRRRFLSTNVRSVRQ